MTAVRVEAAVDHRAHATPRIAVNKFRNAPSAMAGAFAGALVVQITIVAFDLLTAERLSVIFANLPGRGAYSGEPRGPDGAGFDQRVRRP